MLDPRSVLTAQQIIFCLNYHFVPSVMPKPWRYYFSSYAVFDQSSIPRQACALVADLEILEYGDLSEVGERGVSF